MAESNMTDLIRASLEGIRDFADNNTVIGTAITTPNGVTVIPVSRITVGFATGGLDYGGKKPLAAQNFGGGGGSGVSVSPIAFLTVGPGAEVGLVRLSDDGAVGRVAHLIEETPVLLEKIKKSVFGK